MTSGAPHPGDELQLLLDGLLSAERRAAVEQHLTDCLRCRRELDALRKVKAAARGALAEPALPAGLAARVTAALDADDHRTRRARRRWRLLPIPLAAVAVLALLLLRGSDADFVAAASRDFAGFRAATLSLQLETTDPAALERFFAGRGVRIPPRVFDFGMMGYRLAGGRVHRLDGRDAILFAYRGAGGHDLVCVMYPGRLAELPAGAEEREHDGIRFRVYRAAGATLVFWQEGAVVCVLVSNADPEEAIQLAYAKAVKV